MDSPWKGPGIALAEISLAMGAIGFSYALLFPDRTDYLGHYLAGAGGTLLLLVVPQAFFRKKRIAWSGLVPVMIAIGLGVISEATIYRLAIFDPVDLANQSLGAAVAGAAVIGRNGSWGRAVVLAAAGILCLRLGYYFAFL